MTSPFVGIKLVKAGFFDPAKILAAADKTHAQAQTKFGAFVRRRMKSSIRYRKAPAAAGQPPSAHRARGGKSPLRELIFFSRDQTTNSVVIGPLPFGRRGAHALEHGGPMTFKSRGQVRTGHMAARPFARPAGEAEAKAFPDTLRGLVK